jgi:aminoglycoside phosphotransferase family enzyme
MMSISTEATLTFLRQPHIYGAGVTQVEVIETHMSWVFLAGDRAFKLKKPICTDYVDFRAIDTRCFYCHEELRLNRRLAPAVYLSVEALSRDANGELHFGQSQERIDCLVQMRRLPESGMLAHALIHGAADAAVMQRVAARIADFHRHLPRLRPDPVIWRASLKAEIDRNERTLLEHQQTLASDKVRMLCDAQRAILHSHAAWFDARIDDGHVVEGHGDLRAEHVCIAGEITVIDCLEFSRELRTLDVADEIAFLALDCERLQAPALADVLLRSYYALSQDTPPAGLVHFYQSLRAGIRARIAIRHLDEIVCSQPALWTQRARQWLALAQQHQDCISSTMDPPS